MRGSRKTVSCFSHISLTFWRSHLYNEGIFIVVSKVVLNILGREICNTQ